MTGGNYCECGTKLRVKETRAGDGNPIMLYRRRWCPGCDDTHWTVEIPFFGEVPKEVKFPNIKRARRVNTQDEE